MKTLLFIIAGFCLPALSAVAQQGQHSTINSYSLSVMPAPANYVPAGSQTADLVTFSVILHSTSGVEKVCLRISSNAQSNGDLVTTCYDLSADPVMHPHGLTLFRREGNVILINRIIPNPQGTTNYELCTEDGGGQKSSYLSQIK